MDSELQKKNVRLGLLLFAVFWLLFAGTIVTAILYLQYD